MGSFTTVCTYLHNLIKYIVRTTPTPPPPPLPDIFVELFFGSSQFVPRRKLSKVLDLCFSYVQLRVYRCRIKWGGECVHDPGELR